jgi:Domain of unknown function (DUF4145)
MQDSGYPTTKSYCNRCRQHTAHDLIAQRTLNIEERDEDGVPMYQELNVYDFVQCRGCESVSMRCCTSGPWSNGGEIKYFPPAALRRLPDWLMTTVFLVLKGPKQEIRSLLVEVYSAMFSGNSRLALIGARTIVDVALTDKLGDIGGFSQKLEQARDQGWITPAQHKVLEVTVEAGSAAAHRAHCPDKRQLELVLDVTEHLIQQLYVLEEHANEIAEKTPPRKPRAES